MTPGSSGGSDSSAPLRQKAGEVDFLEAGRRALGFLTSKWNVELEGLGARAGQGLSARSSGGRAELGPPCAVEREGSVPIPGAAAAPGGWTDAQGASVGPELRAERGSAARCRECPCAGAGLALAAAGSWGPPARPRSQGCPGAGGARRRLALLSLARTSSVAGSDLIQGGFSFCGSFVFSPLKRNKGCNPNQSVLVWVFFSLLCGDLS